MAKKKVEHKPKNIREAVGIQNHLNNEKTDFLLGVFVLLAALYVIIAMVSYFSSGASDQSLLEDLRPGEWLNTDKEFANTCGSIGAIISYFFITVNFGIPSFLIPAFLILVGLKMMKAYRVNLWKWFFGMMIIMLWCSVTFAKFLTPFCGSLVFNPGGYHGQFCVDRIEAIVGSPGLICTLIIVALAFLTYLSAETITIIRKAINPVKYISNKVKFTITNHANGENEEVSIDGQTEVQEEQHTEEEGQDVNQNIATIVDLSPINKEKTTKAENKEKKNSFTVETAAETEKGNENGLKIENIISTQINPLEPFTKYKYPTTDLLKKDDSDGKLFVDMNEINANKDRIVEVLGSFGVVIKEIKATVGPAITLYEITPAEGVRISRIRNLEDDIALSLSALGIRIIAPIPGKGTIGIEVPNKKPNIVSMESLINSKKFQEAHMELPLAIGKTITNDVFMVDLAKIPHLLVAGATGQGKSVGLNCILTSLLYKKHPNELKIILVDPKMVEFSIYEPIAKHFMAAVDENIDNPIITDVNKVVHTLKSLCTLMDNRYELLKEASVRNIKEYNRKYINHLLSPEDGHSFMPYIVVVIDEYGDLIMTAGKEIELPLTRIAQKARAVGIHLIIATQRPTTNIITGSIKANFPGRVAFKVTSIVDSRTILDRSGANQLVGRGDMLFMNGGEPVRVQCAFVDTPEVERINKFISEQPGPVEPIILPEPETDDSSISGTGEGLQNIDPYFEEAAHAIVLSQQGSTSMIQRRFSIGYNRAGRLMDQLEAAGIVGAAQGSKPRDVLITDENSLNNLIAQIKR